MESSRECFFDCEVSLVHQGYCGWVEACVGDYKFAHIGEELELPPSILWEFLVEEGLGMIVVAGAPETWSIEGIVGIVVTPENRKLGVIDMTEEPSSDESLLIHGVESIPEISK